MFQLSRFLALVVLIGLALGAQLGTPTGRSSRGSFRSNGRLRVDLDEQKIETSPAFPNLPQGSPQLYGRRSARSAGPTTASFGELLEREEPGNAPENINPLIKQASTASVGILFGLLIWRSLSSYELADQFVSDAMRLILVIPVIGILILNVIGFVLNFVKPLNFKNHLKAILAINILREWVELAYNAVKLVAVSSKSPIPREVYFGRMFVNVWWTLLCFSFSRSRWVLATPPPSRPRSQF
jgi:hypothetical protein